MAGVYDILVKFIVIYMYSIIFYNLIPFPLTVIIGAIIFLLLVFIHIKKLNKQNFIMVTYVGLVIIYTSLVTSNFSVNFSDVVRVVQLLLFLNLCSQVRHIEYFNKALAKNKRLLLIASKISSLIVLVELIIPKCYYVESSWGSNVYFRGFAPTQHVTASCMCLIIAMYITSVRENQFRITEIVFIIPPLLAIFQSGARVYLLCGAGLLLCYYFLKIRGKPIKYILVPFVVLTLSYIFLSSNMVDKFLFIRTGYVLDSYTVLDRFTSGRTYFWLKDINAFFDSSLIRKIFGNGFHYIYQVSHLSGHNDVIHMLLGIGVIGAIVYLKVFVRAIKMTYELLQKNNIQISIRVLNIIAISLFIFAPMLLNGIYGYPHLVFSIVLMLAYCADYAVVFSRKRNQ